MLFILFGGQDFLSLSFLYHSVLLFLAAGYQNLHNIDHKSLFIMKKNPSNYWTGAPDLERIWRETSGELSATVNVLWVLTIIWRYFFALALFRQSWVCIWSFSYTIFFEILKEIQLFVMKYYVSHASSTWSLIWNPIL